MIFSIQKLVNTLIKIITGSPTSILFIVLGIIFTIAMVINIKKNKTIGKTLFIIGWIFIILFIIIKYNNYLSKLFDNLINNVFMQIFFPNIATYLIIIIVTNIIFLFTVLNKNSKTSGKIINSIFFTIIMVLMIMTIEQISENKINIYAKEEVYTNQNILTLIESTTLIFGIWQIINLSKLILRKLINKSNEKIKKEFKEKEKSEAVKEGNQIEEKTINTPIDATEKSIEPTSIIEETVEPTIPFFEQTIEPTMTPVPIVEETVEPTMPFFEQTIEPTMTPAPVVEETVEPTMPFFEQTIEPTMTPAPIVEETVEPTMPFFEMADEPTISYNQNEYDNEINNQNYPEFNDEISENIFFANFNPEEKEEENIEVLRL